MVMTIFMTRAEMMIPWGWLIGIANQHPRSCIFRLPGKRAAIEYIEPGTIHG